MIDHSSDKYHDSLKFNPYLMNECSVHVECMVNYLFICWSSKGEISVPIGTSTNITQNCQCFHMFPVFPPFPGLQMCRNGWTPMGDKFKRQS